MKRIKSKRIVSVIMAAVMAFSMALPCRADGAMPIYIKSDITEISFVKVGSDFRYSVTDKSDIDYIVWMINKMSLGAERTDKWDWGDGEIYITLLNPNGGGVQILVDPVYDFVYTEPSVEQTFCFKEEEFSYFWDIITAMRSGDYGIDGEISEEPSKWASDYIDRAKEKNCIPNLNRVRYSAPVNRLDVCEIAESFLLEYLGNIIVNENDACRFEDCDRRSVLLLGKIGAIDGRNDDRFCPYDMMTREEMAKVLANLWCYINNESLEDVRKSGYNDYDEISDWAKVYVDKVTELEILQGNDLGNFEPKRYMTKEEAVVALLRLFERGNEVVK